MFKKVTNESGLELEILSNSEEESNEFMGGNTENPSWKEYVDDFLDKYKGHVELLKKSIIENEMIGFTGEKSSELSFKFSDGEHWSFSWRAWGDLMQAIVDKREGYMAYYM